MPTASTTLAIFIGLLFMKPGCTSSFRINAIEFGFHPLRQYHRIATTMLSSISVSNTGNISDKEEHPAKKVHTVTVCVVPPPEYREVWETISQMRQQLKDPGYHRWPPHVNLLYPFLQLGGSDDLKQIVGKLHTATRRCAPFPITLKQFGTFGGKKRGVLWFSPDSARMSIPNSDKEGTVPSPLATLQKRLEDAFPLCKDQSQKGAKGTFVAHMTLSHFQTLDDALAAQELLERDFTEPLDFVIDRVYLLQRKGDGGQFERVAEVGLGQNTTVSQIFHPPLAFPDMPAAEDDWIYEERMKMKYRRNRRSGRGGQNRGIRRPKKMRVPDTPEIIAKKRVERKAKRERHEKDRELKEIAEALGDNPITGTLPQSNA